MKIHIYLLCFYVLVLFSCTYQKEQNKISRYFDIEGYFKKEAALLNFTRPPVYKIITSGGKKESRELIGIDWEQELQPFMDADINRAAWKNSYAGDTTENTEYGYMRYIAKDSALATRKILVTFKEGNVVQVTIVKRSSNTLYNSASELVYLRDWGYRISGEQNVRFGKQTRYIAEAYFMDSEGGID